MGYAREVDTGHSQLGAEPSVAKRTEEDAGGDMAGGKWT